MVRPLRFGSFRRFRGRGVVLAWIIILIAAASALIYREIDGRTFRSQAEEITRLQQLLSGTNALLVDSEVRLKELQEYKNSINLSQEAAEAEKPIIIRTYLNDFLTSEISKIQAEELRNNLGNQVGIWETKADFGSDRSWTMDGPGIQSQPDGRLAFTKGLWEVRETYTTVNPIDAEATNFLDVLFTWQEITPTPEPTATPGPTPIPAPTPTYGDAEAILSTTLSKCISVLEGQLGSPAHITFSSTRAGNYILLVGAKSDTWNLDFGVWEIRPLRFEAIPADHSANAMQNILAGSGATCTPSYISSLR